ncbi:MAG: hypothetical protein WD601_14615 [Pseudohongiellaceae bacterium]
MSDLVLFSLLVAAVACGWALARWQLRGKLREDPLPKEAYELPYYFSGDIPDYALDAFISAVDVNSDTLETHLALAAIHRRRGEIDRAIRIHENLLKRDGLTASQVSQAKFELSLDYVKAGLHDRAEEYLQELVEKSVTHKIAALHMLIDLYQDARDWLKASYAANALLDYLDNTDQARLLHRCSHFHCEQAEKAIRSKDYLSARRHINRAESAAPVAIRPIILMASLELQLNHPEKARVIIEQQLQTVSVEVVEEALKLLKLAYAQLGKAHEYIPAIESLYRSSGSAHILSLLARELIAAGRKERLHQILIDVPPADLANLPLALIAQWDDALIASLGSGGRLGMPSESTLNEGHYQCQHCGLELREYMWQCPGCRRWETLRTRNQIHV